MFQKVLKTFVVIHNLTITFKIVIYDDHTFVYEIF